MNSETELTVELSEQHEGKHLRITQERWRPGLTTLMPYYVNNKPHFLNFDSTDGSDEFRRLNSKGTGFIKLGGGTTSQEKGLTTFMPFYLKKKPHKNKPLKKEPHYLAYDSRKGFFGWYKIKSKGFGEDLLNKSKMDKGLTMIPFTYRSGNYFLS